MIGYAVAQAVRVVEAARQKKFAGDFQPLLDEFEGYWSTVGGFYSVPLMAPPEGDRQLYAQIKQLKKSKTNPKATSFLQALDYGSGKDCALPRRKVNYFPMSSAIVPPVNGKPLGPDWMQTLFTQAGPCAERVSQQDGQHIFLFSQPRSTGDDSLFGITFVTRHQNRQVIFTDTKPFSIQRAWRDHMIARTGSRPLKKHVAIIGCGAVGSRVADQLALSGIDELTLIDHDYLSYDNIYRHVLGSNGVGKYKVDALKHELESKRTGIVVHAFSGTAEQWLSETTHRKNCDTIVLTTGQPALERAINRRAFAEQWPQRLISGWLEPLGLGGHVMATGAGVKECIECLYTDIGASRPDMRVAFLAPGQKVSRNLTGCSGRFMPFSALHATETATLVSKAVLADATGYFCWAGDDTEALQEGLRVTPWHAQLRLNASPVSVFHHDCPCCSI